MYAFSGFEQMARIAIDMDEVVADSLGEHLKRYNAKFATTIDREALKGSWLREVIPTEHWRDCWDMVNCEDFFENLNVMPGAQEVIERLNKQHEIYIVTAAMEVPPSLAPKYRWLQRHFPFVSPLNYVFCGHKHVVAADYLIDDHPKHFKLFPGEGILFDAPHNHNVTGYRRVHNWHEAEELFANAEQPTSVST